MTIEWKLIDKDTPRSTPVLYWDGLVVRITEIYNGLMPLPAFWMWAPLPEPPEIRPTRWKWKLHFRSESLDLSPAGLTLPDACRYQGEACIVRIGKELWTYDSVPDDSPEVGDMIDGIPVASLLTESFPIELARKCLCEEDSEGQNEAR